MNKIEKLAILIEKLEEAEALLASIRNDEVWMFENTETAMEDLGELINQLGYIMMKRKQL